jgi:hypothetical protein
VNPERDAHNSLGYKRILALFNGEQKGSEEIGTTSAYAWVNAVTQYVDWERGFKTDSRMKTAWKTGQKARLIVGDTLARLSVGGNENAGQDMGLGVRRIDRIRAECRALFLLIHHSGKVAAAGARGWSGVRAAVDTEIEVTDSPTGRGPEYILAGNSYLYPNRVPLPQNPKDVCVSGAQSRQRKLL